MVGHKMNLPFKAEIYAIILDTKKGFVLSYRVHYCGDVGLKLNCMLLVHRLNRKREVKRQWRKTEYVRLKQEKAFV